MGNFLSNLGKINGTMGSPQGGGEALPPFLQMRSMVGMGTKSKPVLTPKSYVAPGEAKAAPQAPTPIPQGMAPAAASVPNGAMANVAPPAPAAPATPPAQAPAPIEGQGQPAPQTINSGLPKGAIPLPEKFQGHGLLKDTFRKAWIKENQAKLGMLGYTWSEKDQAFIPGGANAGGNFGSPQQTYDYLKGELQHETDLAKSNSAADAASRGVYYGTPLTSSYGDINTSYLKGLGALDAAMWEKSSQMQLQKLALAAQLIPGLKGSNFDPSTLAILGQLWGYGNGAGQPQAG